LTINPLYSKCTLNQINFKLLTKFLKHGNCAKFHEFANFFVWFPDNFKFEKPLNFPGITGFPGGIDLIIRISNNSNYYFHPLYIVYRENIILVQFPPHNLRLNIRWWLISEKVVDLIDSWRGNLLCLFYTEENKLWKYQCTVASTG